MFRPLVQVLNIGRSNYLDTLKIQLKYRDKIINSIKDKKCIENYLILVEHEPVYTIGIRSKNYSLDFENYLRSFGADFQKTTRGGLITFHGLGQLTVYPILYLGSFKTQKSIKKYVHLLENVIINVTKNILKEVPDLSISTLEKFPGVWINSERKIAAIGINCKQYVTMHGLSLNCNINLDWFEKIVPCGILDKQVTSISQELGFNFTVKQAIPYFINSFRTVFKCDTIDICD